MAQFFSSLRRGWVLCCLRTCTFAKNLSVYGGLAFLPNSYRAYRHHPREFLVQPLRNTSWARKPGTTLLLSALYGPATAGFFFILLRLSEIISMLGAISCDVLLGELAQGCSLQGPRFSRSNPAIVMPYSFALTWPSFSVSAPATSTDLGPRLVFLPSYAGAVVAMLRLASAINRKAVYAAMGLGAVRLAAFCGLTESVAFLTLVGLLPVKIAILDRLALAPRRGRPVASYAKDYSGIGNELPSYLAPSTRFRPAVRRRERVRLGRRLFHGFFHGQRAARSLWPDFCYC